MDEWVALSQPLASNSLPRADPPPTGKSMEQCVFQTGIGQWPRMAAPPRGEVREPLRKRVSFELPDCDGFGAADMSPRVLLKAT
jgi:hypothetical protein